MGSLPLNWLPHDSFLLAILRSVSRFLSCFAIGKARVGNGRSAFGMQHHGRTYLFAGPEEQQKFLANPDRFSPVMSGDDPVLALDQGQHVAGSRMYGVSYADHVYLFTSEQTLQMFQQNPKPTPPKRCSAALGFTATSRGVPCFFAASE